MKVSHHVISSAIISGIVFTVSKSFGMTIASFISGIFIDLDHFIDYLILEGSHFKVKDFFNFIYEERNEKIIFIFHGWEWSVVLAAAAWFTGWNPWVIGVLIGYGHHMLLDAIFNKHWPLSGYSFLWRWKKHFVAEMIRPRKSEINKV